MPRSVFWRFFFCLPARYVSVTSIYIKRLPTGSGWAHTLLSGGALGLGGKSHPDEAVLGLELLHGLGGVVDEGEARGLAATELGAQAEDGDLVLLGLVEAAELLAELILGDVGAVGVEDVPAANSQHLCLVPEVQRGVGSDRAARLSNRVYQAVQSMFEGCFGRSRWLRCREVVVFFERRACGGWAL